jgi:hypothetical protein
MPKKIFVRIAPDGSRIELDVKDQGPPSCCETEDQSLRDAAEKLGGLSFERESIHCNLTDEDSCPLEEK